MRQHEPHSSTHPQTLHWSTARPWQTNATLILIGTGLFLLSRQLVTEYHHFTIGFSGVSGWSAILYIAAVIIILTQPVDRLTFPIILTVAIICRIAPLFAEPYLSTDIYRYVWDGIVQHAHISPYRYVPGDPALAFLRAPHQNIFDHINRRDTAHTIYPPAAQLLFYLITWISPTITFMKTAMVLFEAITMAALIALLHHLGLRKEQSLLYAWCPLLIWEIAGAGHLDSTAMAFIALALLFRYRKQPILTGLFLAMAILLKFYPLVLLPALYRRGDYKMPATVAALIAAGYAAYSSAGLLVFGFLGGYAKEEGLETGTRYFLLQLTQQIPGLHNLPTIAFYLFSAAVFAAIVVWPWKTTNRQGSKQTQPTTTSRVPSTEAGAPSFALFAKGGVSGAARPHSFANPKVSDEESKSKTAPNPGAPSSRSLIALRWAFVRQHEPHSSPNPEPPGEDSESNQAAATAFLPPTYALAAALMFLFSPHYGWYIIWLIPFFTLMPNLPILTYLMGFFYLYTMPFANPGPGTFFINKILYTAVFAAFIIHLTLQRWPLHRRHFVQPTRENS